MTDYGEAAATVTDVEAKFYQLEEDLQNDNNLKGVIILTHAMADRCVKEQREEIIRGIELEAEQEKLEKRNAELQKKRHEVAEGHNKVARQFLVEKTKSDKLNRHIKNATDALQEAVHCMEEFIDSESTAAAASKAARENQNFCVFPLEMEEACWTFQHRVSSHTDVIKDCSQEVATVQMKSNKKIYYVLRKSSGKVSVSAKKSKNPRKAKGVGNAKSSSTSKSKGKKISTVNKGSNPKTQKISTEGVKVKEEREEKPSEPQTSTATSANIKNKKETAATTTKTTAASATNKVRRSSRISKHKTIKAESKKDKVEKPTKPKAGPEPEPKPGPSTPKKKTTIPKKRKNSATNATRLINKLLMRSISSVNSMPPPTPTIPTPAPLIAARKFASITPMTIQDFKARQQSTPTPPPPSEQVAKPQAPPPPPPPPKTPPPAPGPSKVSKPNKVEKTFKKSPFKPKMMLRKHRPINISSPKVALPPTPRKKISTRASQPQLVAEATKPGKSQPQLVAEATKPGKSQPQLAAEATKPGKSQVEKKNPGVSLASAPSETKVKVKGSQLKTVPVGRPKTRFQSSGGVAAVIPAVAVNHRPQAPAPAPGPAPGPARAPALRRIRLRRSLRGNAFPVLPKRKRQPPKRFED